MAAGEEKYLLAKDKGPQRRFVRDHVDARLSVGELMIPFLGAAVITGFLFKTPLITTISTFALYGFMLVAILDIVFLRAALKRKISAKFGAEKIQRGFLMYAATRVLTLRPMRLPKPQVKRGVFPS